jgi:hypothetical protein
MDPPAPDDRAPDDPPAEGVAEKVTPPEPEVVPRGLPVLLGGVGLAAPVDCVPDAPPTVLGLFPDDSEPAGAHPSNQSAAPITMEWRDVGFMKTSAALHCTPHARTKPAVFHGTGRRHPDRFVRLSPYFRGALGRLGLTGDPGSQVPLRAHPTVEMG